MNKRLDEKRVELEIYSADGQGFGLTISRMIGGSGEGYRIFGPKLYGQSETIAVFNMDTDDIDRLIGELKDCKKFLKSRKK